ncbi:unnamed protein product [Durusdinium trenchii]
MKRTVDDAEGGFLTLDSLLSFNRLKALGVTSAQQLAEAVRRSQLLELDGSGARVRRDFQKHPLGTYDAISRTLYVEGLPLTFGIDDLTTFFSEYGQVKLLELPHHRETREPRGFCFVEFASSQEADKALAKCNGLWPQAWPQRYDGKTVRAMRKADWHKQCREYKTLQAASRGPSFQGKPKEEVPKTRPRKDAEASEAETKSKPKPSQRPGCVVKITGLKDAEHVINMQSIRHYAEHAVAVEYCDYLPSLSLAYLRLKSPEDCVTLLEDVKATGRLLGCDQPSAEVLGPDEEEKYWQDVVERHASRDEQSGKFVMPPSSVRREREHIVSRIRRWRPVTSSSSKFKAGFTDTAGGNADFVPAGFGKSYRKAKKIPKVIPPRKRRDVPDEDAKSRKALPAVPPPSPFQLPGTTRKRRLPGALPPPSPAHAFPPPSPAIDSLSPDSDPTMSPEVDRKHASPSGDGEDASQATQEDGPGDLDDLDPDLVMSVMEDFN